ncbi:hypothetical protein Taro_037528 [Colocasia esculenta]|uniref:Uncharacterized protein n=1 Tax=Colocasia esculenta TaxID=4460 RepID=A0A843WJJ5_COLES|nr:hypothetical protein [Colocasia esculenta]
MPQPPPCLANVTGYMAASRSSGFYRNATSVPIAIASRQGMCRVQMNQACCGALSRRVLIATGSTVTFWFLITTVSSPRARHLRACPRDRLLSLPGTPSPARLLGGVLRAAGVLKSRTWSRRGKWWGQRRRVVCRALLAGLGLRGSYGALTVRLHSSSLGGGLRRRARSSRGL